MGDARARTGFRMKPTSEMVHTMLGTRFSSRGRVEGHAERTKQRSWSGLFPRVDTKWCGLIGVRSITRNQSGAGFLTNAASVASKDVATAGIEPGPRDTRSPSLLAWQGEATAEAGHAIHKPASAFPRRNGARGSRT